MEEQLVKFTIDIDSRDKLIEESAFKFLPLTHEYIINSLNPYEIKIYFGNNQEKTTLINDGKKQIQILNPYISKNLSNVTFIKLLNCVFPRYFNVKKQKIDNEEKIINEDIFDQRYIIVKININESTKIYSTNQYFDDCIKLKANYSPNEKEKYIILTPLHSDYLFFFKNGQLKDINSMEIKFYDDSYNPIILDYTFLLKFYKHLEKIGEFIRNHSVNLQFEIGCYEINNKNTNSY